MRRRRLARGIRNKRLPDRSPADRREGFWFEGRWITPEMAHAACKELMERVDALPKEKREYLHQHGRLPDE